MGLRRSPWPFLVCVGPNSMGNVTNVADTTPATQKTLQLLEGRQVSWADQAYTSVTSTRWQRPRVSYT
jgi:hypothetical protein